MLASALDAHRPVGGDYFYEADGLRFPEIVEGSKVLFLKSSQGLGLVTVPAAPRL